MKSAYPIALRASDVARIELADYLERKYHMAGRILEIIDYLDNDDFKPSVRCASTANINLASLPAAVDGITLAIGDRVLVKNQTSQPENGVYEVVTAGAGGSWKRSADADSGTKLSAGTVVVVESGTANAKRWYMQTTTGAITIGVSNIVWQETSGAGFVLAADLISTANGKGASLVGLEDAAGRTNATTVEGAINELPAAADIIKRDGSVAFTGVVAGVDPTLATHLATKAYVDAVATGLDPKASVRAATTGALPASTYANGAAGVGATLTGDANGALAAQDGVTLLVNERILVKDQVDGFENGIYKVTQVGDAGTPFILTRATDADTAAELTGGAYVFVEEGTVGADSGFVCTTDGAIVVGTTNVLWSQFSGAGQITAGAALTKTGNTLDVNVDGSTIEVNADALRVKALGINDTHVAAANKDGVAGTASMRTLGNGAQQACAGNDARLSDARAPTAHAASHTNGTDDIQDATAAQKGLATATQITKLDGIATGAQVCNEANVRTALAALTVDPNFNARKLTNLATPTATGDAATKGYVDSVAQGLRLKPNADVATTAALADAYTSAATTLTRVGNGALPTLDGVAPVLDAIYIVKNQAGADEKDNGWYKLTQVGDAGNPWILTRIDEANTAAEIGEGSFGWVKSGTANANTRWAVLTGPATLGTNPVTFTQIGGALSTEAGAGLVQNGAALDVAAGDGIEINADAITVKLDGATLTKGAAGLKVTTITTSAGAGDSGKIPALDAAGLLDKSFMPAELRQEDVFKLVGAAADRVTNTVAETAFTNKYTIPANVPVGTVIDVFISGTIPSDNATDTLALALKVGGSTIMQITAFDAAAGDDWAFKCQVQVTVTGAGGRVDVWAHSLDTNGSPIGGYFLFDQALDLSATKDVTVTATWSVANAANQVDLRRVIVRRNTMTPVT